MILPRKTLAGAALALGTALAALAAPAAHAGLADRTPYTVTLDANGFRVDGEYRLLRGGSVQWFRLPRGEWRDRLQRFKAAGFNTVDMYVAWNQVERTEGVFDFANPDLKGFLDLCAELGLYVYFRPGPYITNEMDGGGVPAWLMDRTTKKSTAADGLVNPRTDDPDWLYYVNRYLTKLNTQIKPYLASNGGPIVLYSLENEYNWFQTFHEVDKLFWLDGGPERDLFASVPARNYFTALRNRVRADGIDVPLTTCPGDGKASWTGDVDGIVPMPNVYNGLGGEKPEKVAYDLLSDMHSWNHGGVYRNMPTGTTETDRDPTRIKRMIMGGMDATFAFNVVGMHQSGYMNSVVLNANGGNLLDKVFDFSSVENVLTAFVAPTVGYFHNVVDYDGAISPSGVHRAKFYDFRRDNLFFDAVETRLAAAGHARRSGLVAGADPRFTVTDTQLGAIEDSNRIHYWHEGADGERFLSIVNMTGYTRTVGTRGLSLDGQAFPRFVPVTVPAGNAAPGQFAPADATYAMVLLHNYPVDATHRIAYTTAEVLTLRDFNAGKLLVVHGNDNAQGEIALTGGYQLVGADAGFVVRENTGSTLTLTFGYADYGVAVLRDNAGNELRVVAMPRDAAGRTWFTQANGHDVMLSGIDYVDADRLQDAGYLLDAVLEIGDENHSLFVLADRAPSIGAFALRRPYDALTQGAIFTLNTPVTEPTINAGLLKSGRARSDVAEAALNFDNSGWMRWIGEPQSLEWAGINKGHAWYRTEFNLDGWNWLPWWEPTDLYIAHAADIVGIYVNGTYLTTLNPLGTEIDSDSWNRAYQFPSLRPYLRQGKNVIAFRVEVWGHGSFMFPRGTLTATSARIPAVGFDSEKGLMGEAKMGWRTLDNWSVRAELGGERAGYASASYGDSTWAAQTLPAGVPKGDVRWYRTKFDAASLPNPEQFRAPVVLNLEGRNVKATIWLNGVLIGRWISDTQWLERGFWGRAQRDMWMNTDPDQFPVARSLLKPAGQQNVLAIAFEDTSSDVESAGYVSTIDLRLARENAGQADVRVRKPVSIAWY